MSIDFNKFEKNKFLYYGGGNGNKIAIVIENENYMMKLPSRPTKTDKMTYTNSCISEYIGSNIFNLIGIKAQKTLLGTYEMNGKKKIAVACLDFTSSDIRLIEFAKLKNSCVDSSKEGYGIELDSVVDAIKEQELLPPDEIENFFWDMFIVDAYIGNFDRHNGNWGILINDKTNRVELAPVYDCGSALYAQMPVEEMQRIINTQSEIKNRIYTFPQSAIKIDNKKINYFDFISSLQNEDCNKALKRIVPLINVSAINKMIDEIEYIEPIQKEFYKTMLQERKSKILDFSLDKLLRKEYDEKISCKNQTNIKEVDIGE